MAVKKPKAPKKIKLPIAFNEDVYMAIKAKAESENRSMSSQAVWEIRKGLGLIEPSDKQE